MSTDMPASAPQYPNGPQQHAPQFQNAPQAEQIPPAPKKKSVFVRILAAIAGLVVAGVVIYGFNYLTSDAAQSKAGDCASLTGTTTKPEFKTVDCGSAEANYTVGRVLGSPGESCGGAYDEYSETARRGPDSKLCLVPNMVEGKCYQLEGNEMGYKSVDCTESGAFKLVEQVKDAGDDSACTDALPLSYPESKLTLCFLPGQNA